LHPITRGTNWSKKYFEIERLIWETSFEHGMTIWLHTTLLYNKLPPKSHKFMQKFDNIWLCTSFFDSRNGKIIMWQLMAKSLRGN